MCVCWHTALVGGTRAVAFNCFLQRKSSGVCWQKVWLYGDSQRSPCTSVYFFFSPKPVFSLLRLALGSTAIKQISSALVPASDTCSFCVRGTAATVTAAGDRRAREEAEQEQVKHARCCGHRVPSSPLNYGTEVATWEESWGLEKTGGGCTLAAFDCP